MRRNLLAPRYCAIGGSSQAWTEPKNGQGKSGRLLSAKAVPIDLEFNVHQLIF
jgi:hypothetical protein